MYQTWTETVETTAETMKRRSTARKPEAVLVEIPGDVQENETPEFEYTPTARPKQRIRPDRDRLAEAASLVEEAAAPVVLAGGGAVRSGAGEALASFATHVGAPIAPTYFGRSALPESHPVVSGIAGIFMMSAAMTTFVSRMSSSFAGARLSGKSTWYGNLFADADIVQIDVDEEAISTYHNAAVGVVADARETITELLNLSPRIPSADRVAETIADAPVPWEDGFETLRDRSARSPSRFRSRSDGLDRHVGSGNNTGFPAVFHPLEEDGEMFVNRNFGTMGHSLPASLGALMGAPDRQVVCYTGDGY